MNVAQLQALCFTQSFRMPVEGPYRFERLTCHTNGRDVLFTLWDATSIVIGEWVVPGLSVYESSAAAWPVHGLDKVFRYHSGMNGAHPVCMSRSLAGGACMLLNVYRVCVSRDGCWIAVVFVDKYTKPFRRNVQVWRWDRLSWRRHGTISIDYGAEVCLMVFSPSGRHLFILQGVYFPCLKQFSMNCYCTGEKTWESESSRGKEKNIFAMDALDDDNLLLMFRDRASMYHLCLKTGTLTRLGNVRMGYLAIVPDVGVAVQDGYGNVALYCRSDVHCIMKRLSDARSAWMMACVRAHRTK
jgi:hypothetical protein